MFFYLIAGVASAALIAASAPAPAPAPAPSAAPSAAQIYSPAAVERARTMIEQAAAKNEFTGVVLVARDGKPIIEKTHGLANRATGEPIRPDTQFSLASADKFITRLAIFQLLQAGKLQLSDPVGKHLPHLPNEDLKRKVTIQHLLDMKGGVPSFWNARYLDGLQRLRTTDDYLDLFVRDPLRFEPGSKQEYSNGGFIVLGAIIERASGMSYVDYVRKHITGPAGMTNTGLFPHNPTRSGRAVGYTAAGEAALRQMRAPSRDQGSAGGVPMTAAASVRPNSDLLPFRGSPAGGGYSTARDLLRLDRAIRADKLLQPRFTDLFLKGSFRRGEGRATGWNGGAPGQNVQFIMYPDGLTVIVLTNQDPPAANRLANRLAEAFGKKNPFG